MMESQFQRNLKRLLEEKGITERELAEKIGISDVRMNKLMNEESPVRPYEIANLLIYFDCKPSELFGNWFDDLFDD